MNVILKRSGLPLLAVLVLTIGCGSKPSQPSAPTAPTPTTPAPSPGPSDPPPRPPQPVTCAYTVTAEPDDFDRDGGNGTLRIAAAAGCKWNVKGDASWAAVEGATQGDGDAALKVSVQPNDDAQARRMTFTIENQRASVSQPGQGDCTYQVSPVSIGLAYIRSSGTIAIETMRGCRWTAASDASWLRLASNGASGSARLTYDADGNSGNGSRQALVQIRWPAPTAGQNVRIDQSPSCSVVATPATGGLPTGATFAGGVSGGTVTVSAGGGTVHLWVLAEPWMSCPWAFETSDSWLTWNYPRPHQVSYGDGDLDFTVPSNPSSNGRTATATLGPWPLTIIQRGR